jgi:hypothetical protein
MPAHSPEPKPNPPEPQPGQGYRGLWTWPNRFAYFLLIYLLATGPAAQFEMRFPSSKPAVEAVYAPLIILSQRCKPLQNALLWYLTVIWRVPIPIYPK